MIETPFCRDEETDSQFYRMITKMTVIFYENDQKFYDQNDRIFPVGVELGLG